MSAMMELGIGASCLLLAVSLIGVYFYGFVNLLDEMVVALALCCSFNLGWGTSGDPFPGDPTMRSVKNLMHGMLFMQSLVFIPIGMLVGACFPP